MGGIFQMQQLTALCDRLFDGFVVRFGLRSFRIIKMASDQVSRAGFLKQMRFGFLIFAFRHNSWASCMKTATFRGIFGIRNIALQDNARFAPPFWIRPGYCGHQGLSIWVFWLCKERLAIRHFYDLTQVHDRDRIADVLNDGQVM